MIATSVPIDTLTDQWKPLTAAKELSYARYFASSDDAESYENSWAFVAQETRAGGWTLETKGALLTATIKSPDSPFVFMLPPIWDRNTASALEVAHTMLGAAGPLARLTGRRIIARKMPSDLYGAMHKATGCVTVEPRTFTCSNDVPEDIYPQVVVPTDTTLQGARFMRLRGHIHSFVRTCAPVVRQLAADNIEDVRSLVASWRKDYDDRVLGQGRVFDVDRLSADGSAYTYLAERFAHRVDGKRYISFLVYTASGHPVGFGFAVRLSPTTAALYGSLTATEYRGASEFLITTMFEQLAEVGVRYLNMGGSETEGLFRFKSKFGAVRLRPSFDVEISGARTSQSA